MTASVIRGDARDLPLPDGSVDLIVTSPPYDPGERARALQVTKPPQVHDDQMPLFDLAAVGP